MRELIEAYRVSAAMAFRLADPSTFWETLHLHGVRVGSLGSAYAETMGVLPDYGAECGIPVGDGRLEEAGVRLCAPPGTEIVCYLTRHDLKVIQSRWARRRDQVGDELVGTCFQFVANIRNCATYETDRVLVVIADDARD